MCSQRDATIRAEAANLHFTTPPPGANHRSPDSSIALLALRTAPNPLLNEHLPQVLLTSAVALALST
jgi:hypothetical protein